MYALLNQMCIFFNDALLVHWILFVCFFCGHSNQFLESLTLAWSKIKYFLSFRKLTVLYVHVHMFSWLNTYTRYTDMILILRQHCKIQFVDVLDSSQHCHGNKWIYPQIYWTCVLNYNFLLNNHQTINPSHAWVPIHLLAAIKSINLSSWASHLLGNNQNSDSMSMTIWARVIMASSYTQNN